MFIMPSPLLFLFNFVCIMLNGQTSPQYCRSYIDPIHYRAEVQGHSNILTFDLTDPNKD